MEAASVPAATTTERTATKRKPPKAPGTPWWLWLAVAGIVVFCLLPFYWLINISLKTGSDLSSADIIPPNPSLENYKSIFELESFRRSVVNSAIVSLVTTLIGVVVGSFAAYALARLKMPYKFPLLALVLSITTFPQIAIAAPLFRLWTDIGLYNTLIGLVIPYLTFALP
ncbi:MAG TPA: carbohydrate ABC transporter permease, partial [Microbacterium sp.]|nr:carbohydrate ABC transporter permease [Microbacterium sp.]